MFLCYPKVSANEELYVRGDIMLNINRFEDEISDPLGKETFLYDDTLPNKEGQISFGKKGYSKEKYNIALAEAKAIREYIEKPENVRYFMDYSEFTKIDDTKHPLLFPLVKEFKKHLDELISSSVTGTRLDVRYYKQEIKKYDFLFQTDTGNPDNNFYDDPVTFVPMPGTGEQVIKYYVKKADANLYGEKHNQITSLISSYNDLDFASTELTNSFNDFVSFYNDFINNKRYTGNLVKFKIKKEDTTTELNLHGHVSFGTSYSYFPFYYYFKSGEHILRTHFATEEEINNGKIIKVNGIDRKFIPKVFYYVLIRERYDICTVKKQYIDLKTTGNITSVGLPIIDNTFYVEWVPETPVVTFKIRPLAENFKNHEILYSTKIVNFSSWEGNIPEIPDYQEFAKCFTDADEAYFLNISYNHDKKHIIKSIGWRNKYNGELYNFNEVPTEDLTLYAVYEIYEMDATYFYRFYNTNCYYDNKLIGKKYVSFEIDKVTKIAKFKQDDNLHNDIHIFDEYLYDHNRRYHLEKLVDDEGNEIDLNSFDFDRYENLLKEGKCRLIYSHYEKFYQVEFNCKEIKVYGNAFHGTFNANLKKYFFKGDIIGEDVTREFDKYCQDPQGKMVQKLSYWREKETK